MIDTNENKGEILIFNREDGTASVQVDLMNETLWLTQKSMAELFGVQKPAIVKHLQNIYAEGELDEASTVSKMEIVQLEGNRQITRQVTIYNLDAIIAVGYRVNSKTATQFRIWATNTLRDYIVKGYVLDDERFKKGQSLTYFKELIDRIREIRLSERLFYQQIKDIYRLSIDYDANDQRTKEFFAKVQNKLLWAVSKQTAAELIAHRADPNKPLMGLTSTEKEGVVKATDVVIGKNYLTEQELTNLKLIVDQYLSFAEAQAVNHIAMRMEDWEKYLDVILTMNRRDILQHAGTIRKEVADRQAQQMLATYNERLREQEHIESIKELDRDLKALGVKK